MKSLFESLFTNDEVFGTIPKTIYIDESSETIDGEFFTTSEKIYLNVSRPFVSLEFVREELVKIHDEYDNSGLAKRIVLTIWENIMKEIENK